MKLVSRVTGHCCDNGLSLPRLAGSCEGLCTFDSKTRCESPRGVDGSRNHITEYKNDHSSYNFGFTFPMYEELMLDGSDDTTGVSTQTQRRTGLKETMKSALLILDGLDRSSINDLTKDQEYRILVHRFLSPLTDLPLQDAIDQANRVLQNGLDEISRAMAGLYPVTDTILADPARSESPRVTIPASDLISPQVQPTVATITTSLYSSSLSVEPTIAPRTQPPLTPLHQIKNDKRKMVTIHFLLGSMKEGSTLQDVIGAVNHVIWKRADFMQQRVLEGWMTKNKDIVLACKSPIDANSSWLEDLDFSHLCVDDTLIRIRRGATTEYVARLTIENLTFSLETLELTCGENDNLVAQLKAQLIRRWGVVHSVMRLGPGIYLCSGPDDVLSAFASAPPQQVHFIGLPVSGIREMVGATIVGTCLFDDLNSISHSCIIC